MHKENKYLYFQFLSQRYAHETGGAGALPGERSALGRPGSGASLGRRLGSGAVGQVKVRAVPFPTAGFSAGMSHLGLFQSTLFWVLFLELGSP